MLPTVLLVTAIVFAAPAALAQYAEGAEEGEGAPLAGAPDKFEGGFYEKIWGLIQESADAGDSITRHGQGGSQKHADAGDSITRHGQGGSQKHADAENPIPYHHVIIQISGDDDEEIRLNKVSLVERLEAVGAHGIVPADVLSFVTAYVPVTEIPGISLFGEVYLLGDGSIPTVSQMDRARGTISATAADLAGLSDGTIDGSGVTVAVIDFGINHINLNPKVDARIYCPTGSCEIDGGNNNSTLTNDQLDDLLSSSVTHGTIVANVIAASGMSQYNGIAPGVRLLDGYSPTRGEIVTALDWAITNGADVAQISLVLSGNTCISSYILNNAINQAVSEGMVVVSAAGNDGSPEGAFAYNTVREPSCAQNVISVGGINDRTATPTLYDNSSLGPVTYAVPRLVPHLTAPAYGITLWSTSTSSTSFATYSGTSVAAPMTSAAVAMTLQTNPDLSPAETKSLLLLGTDWTGPVPCTSTQYETFNTTDHCSYAAQRSYFADHTLETLNHVGFGILDVARSLGYAADSSSHVISSSFDSSTRTYLYGINVTEPLDQTKVTLTWLVPFLFSYNTANFDFTVTCPGLDHVIRAESDHQTVEFAVFEPVKAGVCAMKVSAVTGSQDFTLASTYPLGPAPSEFVESDIIISAEDGTYTPNDTIEITMKFPRAVSVQGSSQPYLELDMSGTTRHATYTDTSTDGTTLSFEYVVQDGDVTTDLSYTGTDAVVVPADSSLTDAHTGIPVRPVLPAPGEAGSLSGEHSIVITPSTTTDNINPRLESIERYNPTSATTDSQTLTFKATFSEDVTEVDADDFVLSPDSTGGGGNTNTNTSTSTGQFTQTRSPNLAILDHQTVSDSIIVSDSGTATSVSVAVNISHTYKGDLKVDLVAPDGTTKTLHNRSGGSTNNIVRTYTLSFDGVEVQGGWTLKIRDNANDDIGTLNSWTLTVNYGGGTTTTTTISPVTSISGSGSVYYATVPASQDGTYNLDLVSSGHNIADSASNPLTDTSTTGADETYTVSTTVTDTTNPRLESIERYNPSSQNTDSQSLVYKVTFNESVTGVDASDFVLSSVGGNTGTGSITGISGSGSVYYVTVSAAQDGTYNLDLVSSGHNIADAASNPLTNTVPTGADETYTVSTTVTDTTNPRLESIERYSPSSQNTDSQSLVYEVTFSESVTGVTASDFVLSPDGTGGGGTTTSTGQFTQTRSPNLAIPDLQTVSDAITVSDSGTATSVSVAVDITHTYIGDLKIDLIAPDGTTRTLHNRSGGSTNDIDQTYTPSFGSIPISGAWKLQITDNYNADPGTLNSWTLTINYGDTTTTVNPVTGVSGSGNVYYVTVSSSTDGTYNLDLVSSGHSIEDSASNPLTDTSTTGADETYTVSTTVTDTTNPRLESIERYSPSSQNTDSQSLVYKVTFSESVTGVTASDFVLSPDGTGGGGTTTSTGQFTQTRSPNLAIPDLQTVSDAITVSDSGTATSVSVAVDITHTYIGDLKIDLIAPDGTTRTLHNRSGGSTNDIDQTYAPSFGSIPISGAWKLQINDNYNADPGTLNSWTLTINYGDTTTTVNPVTGVSGSGNVYYVTVSSSTDGTYNLDLVSSGHSIEDSASNPLTDTSTTGADETYTVSTTVTDTTNPRLESIERYSPSSQNTDSQSLVYKVTFSESVTGVTASDFVLSPDGTGGGGTTTSTGQFTQTRSPNLAIPDLQTVSDTITVSDSGTATSVSVAVDITHTYIGDLKIDLIAPDGTTRTLHNRSGGSTNDIDQTYAPSFGSIPISGAWKLQINDNYNADPGTLNSWTLTINYGDTTTTVNPVTGVSGSGNVYYVTVSSSTDGTYNLDLVSSGHSIEDSASNPLTDTSTTGADETYTVSTTVTDTTNPRLESIERYSPSSQNTDSQSLVYKVTFSESVTGVTASDFVLSPDGTGGSASTTSTGQFTQTRSPNLAIPDLQTVSDTITVSDSGTATSVSVAVDITHTYIGDLKIDLIAPDGTTRTLHNRSGGSTNDIDQTYAPSFGSIPISGAWKLQINDNYNADPGTLNSWTLTINYGDTTTTVNPVTGVSGSGNVYYVTVSSSTDGTYNLDLVSSGHSIEDSASNPLTDTSTTGADETYTVSTTVTDTTNPRLESIERYSPSSQNTDSQSLVYKVTFSESVTGVTASDFVLSPDGTGGSASTTSTGQFTQTRSPNLAIPDLQTVSDTITVSDSGTATSVSVAVDITHTYIGDLKIDLIAPDGTTRTLHNRSGGSTNDIDQTYAPSFGSIPISGAWKLQINDNYNADPGTLNSWTLTINYGDTTTTVNPVTGVSGSDDTYYVTVSSSTDGTYNLDLVSSGHSIEDSASNPLTDTSTTGADETYTVSTTVTDTTNPRLESIERYSPSSQNTDSQSLVYKVTFSESVTGVTASDFVLSPDGTGGSASTTSTGQFTQTRSPNLAIPDLQTVSDTITVSDSGTATSVSVAVDITHTYIGDLKIDLIAPDGTTRTLHNRSGGSTNDIDQTYAPSFGSIPISGAWKLQINDNYNADPGTLNSWTLTINYGDTTTTVNPVTGVSDSDDTYYVTVSSSTDGTYNLDLIENSGIKDNADNPLTNTVATGTDQTYTVIAN